MAQVYRAKPRAARAPLTQQEVVGLDHQGRGIVRSSIGTLFVPATVPGDIIDVQPLAKFTGRLKRIVRESSERQVPACRYAADCGGCDLQHLQVTSQLTHKQQVVAELLQKHTQQQPQQWLPVLTGEPWHYRQRTRLAVHWQGKRQQLRLGYRAAGSKDIIHIAECLTLALPLQALLAPLRQLLPQLSTIKMLGHIELSGVDSVAVRLHFAEQGSRLLSAADHDLLVQFAEQQHVQIWLSDQQTEVHALDSAVTHAHYPALWGQLDYLPGDFLQANAALNLALVQQAIDWLELSAADCVLELFAGAGNFTMAMAQHAAQVTAVEGVATMVERLQATATKLQLPVQAWHSDLNQNWQQYQWSKQRFNKVLLDPARAGAATAVAELTKISTIDTVVYVSCAPDTFARDSALLLKAGFTLQRAQVVDMFPQTHHIEVIGLFRKE